MIFEKKSIQLLGKALKKLESGYKLPSVNDSMHFDYDAMEKILLAAAEKMHDNYPYFHPLYAGQMLKPPHPLARAAYMLSMWINPNNHALDGGKASSAMEKEVVGDIASMFGWEKHLGHLTSGGTMANLEALWISGKLNPGKYIIASDQAHYTHQRISEVLGLKFLKIPSDKKGKISIKHLEEALQNHDVGTVIATVGTTGLGAIDPLHEIARLQNRYNFRIHADAAYGGYFSLCNNIGRENEKNFSLLKQVDSIVIDPHKHGLQPYGCGCVIFHNPEVARFYLHDSPYTYFTSDELHLGEISLECSRAGASAVSLWATHQLLPPVKGGEFAKSLSKSRLAALELHKRISHDIRLFSFIEPELDIVVWAIKAKSISQISELANRFFKLAEENQLYLSLFNYPASKLGTDDIIIDAETATCLRSCLMKPEHSDWLDQIWGKITLTLEMMAL